MIRTFEKKDTIAVADLAKKTFAACNAGDYYDYSGVEKTLSSFDAAQHSEQALFDAFNSTDVFFVYEENGNIIGMVRGRKNRIHSMFVGIAHQNKGIGKSLIKKFEQSVIAQGSTYIEIHASLTAAAFYERMGYEKLGDICDFEGLKIYNMYKEFGEKGNR
jgi:predicted N-acetyltransferase YhbS